TEAATRPQSADVLAHVTTHVMHCRICPYPIKAAPGGAAGPASAPGSALGGPPGARRAACMGRAHQLARHKQPVAARTRLTQRIGVPVPAAAIGALPLPSHAIASRPCTPTLPV